jgi:NADH-quinone oxidoreductase subunit L
VGASFALSVRVFLRLAAQPVEARLVTDTLYRWIGWGQLSIDLGFAMDQLGAVMALVVTGVSFIIHIYSLGYMAHDAGFQRFFAYLNLFVFAMLMLVLGENLLIMFIGWEGVGLCSYLLIAFWFNDEANAAAGKKAFIVNRIGDFGFLLGIFLLGTTLLPHLEGGAGVFSFRVLSQHRDLLAPVATLLGLLFFLGATGKSAQIPLYIWLPDAMAGPTPVSALIHAATMVTAGVYMIARMHFLYTLSPLAMQVVAIVGAATALLAATIALAQNDIKKVLAYSTISQLGYMMLACGVGAFAAGIFHLMTHAFFKALLFLGSGSVIHALSGEQDMRRMGGLAGRLPITFWTFLAGTLAIAGIIPFAGFFSKDEILYKTFSSGSGGVILWVVAFLAAGLTAFYMMRLLVLTFAGKSRASEQVRHHIHESPATMAIPLVILAVLSLVGGWIGWPHFLLGGQNHFEHWLEPVFGHQQVAHGLVSSGAPALDGLVVPTQLAVQTGHAAKAAISGESLEWLLMLCALGIAGLGLGLGGWIYGRRVALAEKATRLAGGLPYRTLLRKYYVDEIYEAVFIKPGYWLSRRVLWRIIDVGLIDRLLVEGSALCAAIIGNLLRLLQNGLVRFYAYMFTLGAAAFILYLSLSS